MFVTEAGALLRQGDLCYSWPFPRWQLNEYKVAGKPSGALTDAVVHVLNNGDALPALLCSHDCDVENPRDRMGLLLAPVLPWPFPDVGDDHSLDLRNSVGPDGDGEFSFINFFPLAVPSSDPTGEAVEWRVADFSGLMAVAPPRKVIPLLKKGKHLEMTDETRDQFRTKLAAFFGREQQASKAS
jgi:hypothetical protein